MFLTSSFYGRASADERMWQQIILMQLSRSANWRRPALRPQRAPMLVQPFYNWVWKNMLKLPVAGPAALGTRNKQNQYGLLFSDFL